MPITSATSGSSTRRCTRSAPHHLATPVTRIRRFFPATKSQSRIESVRFAVLGPGGVGGLLGALLSRAGDSVVLLHDSAPRELRVESATFGDFTADVQSAPNLSEPVDAVLVTVKATQLDEALRRVPAAALGEAVVIPFLNGLEHVERLRAAYGTNVVAATIAVES